MPVDLERSDSDLVELLKSLNESKLLDDPEVPGYFFRNKERDSNILAVRQELAKRLGITLNHDGSAN